MKKILLTTLLVLCMAAPAWAVTKTLQISWDNNPEEDLAGYGISITDGSGLDLLPTELLVYKNTDPTPVTIIRTVDLPDNEVSDVTVAVWAYDSSGNESSSAQVTKAVDLEPPAPPSGLDWIVQIIVAFFQWITGFLA